MAPSSVQHRRTHNLLLISKLLNQRDVASPFTLILDSLEQAARPLVAEYIGRAKAANVRTIFVSFETLRRPDVDEFVPAWQASSQWRNAVTETLKSEHTRKTLLTFDSANVLGRSQDLSAVLSSVITPTTSVLAVYHTDIAVQKPEDPYAPPPLTMLKYLATTIFTVHSFHHVLASKAARDRSHVEPSFGLAEGRGGVLQGLGANDEDGVMLEMEHRRKSGRGVREWYVLPLKKAAPGRATTSNKTETVTLLEDHPLYAPKGEGTVSSGDSEDATFELGLTDKQRRDRQGVVLPYLDVQKGGGQGGRILYDMGSEDDFDEEDDEI